MKEEMLADHVVVKYVDSDLAIPELSDSGVFIIQSTSSGRMFHHAVELSEKVVGGISVNTSREIVREEGEIEIIYSKLGIDGPVAVLTTSLHKDGMFNIEAFISCMEKFLEYDFEEKELFVCLYLQKLKGTTWGMLKQYLISRFKKRKVNIILIEDHAKRAEQCPVKEGETGECKSPVEE